jgi:hypothetical protein
LKVGDAAAALDCIAGAAEAASRIYREAEAEAGRPPRGAANGYFAEIGALAKSIKSLSEGGVGRVVDQEVIGSVPRGCIRALFKAFDAAKVKPNKDLVRVCVASVAGDHKSLAVRIHDGWAQVVGVFHPRSFDVSLVVIDPTLTVEELSKAIGRPVRDATGGPPGGEADECPTGGDGVPRGVEADEWVTRANEAFLGRDDVVQIPTSVTRKKRPGAIASIIRGHLHDHPGEVLGVVLWKELHREVVGRLSEGEQARLKLTDWNDPKGLDGCDLTIIIGQPSIPPQAVVKRLVQVGDGAAAVEDGDWGPKPWVASLPWGQAKTVERKAYRHPQWADAYRAITIGRLA